LPAGTSPNVAASASAAPIEPVPSEDAAAIPISPRNPAWGSRTARVTIVEFADFQDPFTARAEDTLMALREKYGPEVLRIVWKHYTMPLHPSARQAAIASAGVFQLAGPGAFWKFHDALLRNQTTLSDDNLERWAGEAGVKDVMELRDGLGMNRWVDAVDADRRDGTSAGVTGAPAFFVNGVSIVGVQPVDRFTTVIDAELAKAQAQLSAGTSPGRLYATMVRMNRAAARDTAPGPTALDDGFSSTTLRDGSGAGAKTGDTLRVDYVGTLLDGTKFDSSIDRKAPFRFKLGTGQVIKGWDRGLLGMKVGEKRRLVIPPTLGYGVHGRPPIIPRNATLVFEVELLAISQD
jgi:FKBP-type peptidyl-prolyl cis-trans isomerase/protein-disulfide isomerase